MSMLERMKTETGTPVPRWLYLLLKPVETLAGGIALAQLTRIPQFWATVDVALIYVWIGIYVWYRNRRKVLTTGPGQIFGDFWYHGILSAIAVILVVPHADLGLRWCTFLAGVALWWVLEVNNYGPIRSPDSP